MTTPTVAPFAWYGGKSRLAGRIVELLPPHRTYVEPFGGAAAVLCSKEPATLEVYNDISSGLVTFFRVLRDRPEELERALRLTPYSRAEFAQCVATWESIEDDVERARRWYVRTRQAFAGSAATVGWGFEANGAQRGGTRASSFATSVDNLERFAQRFPCVRRPEGRAIERSGLESAPDDLYSWASPTEPPRRCRVVGELEALEAGDVERLVRGVVVPGEQNRALKRDRRGDKLGVVSLAQLVHVGRVALEAATRRARRRVIGRVEVEARLRAVVAREDLAPVEVVNLYATERLR